MAPKTFHEMREAMASCMSLNSKADKQFSKSTMAQKSIREIFTSLLDLEETHQFLMPMLIESEKSEEEADKLRVKGNQYYKGKNFEKAIELYNRSIMTAPHPVMTKDTSSYCKPVEEDDCFAFPRVNPARYGGVAKGESKALAKGFANRSAIMYELNLYDKCLHDIAMALEYGYPEELQAKLHERKQKCLEAQQTSNSNNDSNPEVQGLSCLTLQGSNIEEINPQQSSGTPTLRDRLSLTPLKLPVLLDQNKSIPSISSALKMSVTSDKGRSLFAVRDIHPGEVVCVERAYSVNIAQEKLAECCSFCLRDCLTPLPCPGCTEVIFCSESCRVQSLAEEHWIECKILATIISLDIGEGSFPFKMLKSANLSQLKVMLCQLQKEEQDYAEFRGLNTKGVYNSTSYQTVYHLHADEEQLPDGKILLFCQIIFVLVQLLEQSGRFFINDGGESVTPSREDVLLTGTLLLSQVKMIIQNGYACVYEQQCVTEIGPGIFPAASLFNHSCNSSVMHLSFGRMMILQAQRPISAGEEATIAYYPSFEYQTLKQRRKILEKFYGFICHCEACEGKWPIYEDLEMTKFKCVMCKKELMGPRTSCDDCRVPPTKKKAVRIEMKKLTDVTTQVADKFASSGVILESEFLSFCEAVKTAYDYYSMPCHFLLEINRVMEYCLRAGL